MRVSALLLCVLCFPLLEARAEKGCQDWFRLLNQSEMLLGPAEFVAERSEWSVEQITKSIGEWKTRRPEEGLKDWASKLQVLDNLMAVALERELKAAGQKFQRFSRFDPELGLAFHVFAIEPGPHPFGKLASQFWEHKVGVVFAPSTRLEGFHSAERLVSIPLAPNPAWVQSQLVRARTRATRGTSQVAYVAGEVTPEGSGIPRFASASQPKGFRWDEVPAQLAALSPRIEKLQGLIDRYKEGDSAVWDTKLIPAVRELGEVLSTEVGDVTQASYEIARAALAAPKTVGVTTTVLGATRIELVRDALLEGERDYRVRVTFLEVPSATLDMPVREANTRQLMDEVLNRIGAERVWLDGNSLTPKGEGSPSSFPLSVESHRTEAYHRLRDLLTQDASLASFLKVYLEADLPPQFERIRDNAAWQLDEQGYVKRLANELVTHSLTREQRVLRLEQLPGLLKRIQGQAVYTAYEN